MPQTSDAMPADRPADHPDGDEVTLVVGAAIIHGGRVLAARRTTPPEARGFWEFPGGKVEPGEDPDEALVREIAEELRCTVRIRGPLDGEQQIREGYALRVTVAELVDGEPVPHEHDAVRWLAADTLDAVSWLAPDRPFLAELAEMLREEAG